jgi:DNA-binding transcriptional regulator YdaS (Cro superfamily)
MEQNNAQTRTLKRAARIAGSEERLAQLLGCEVAQLRVWTSGEQPTPPQVYLRALDIVSRGPG